MQNPPQARCFLEEGGHGTWRYHFTAHRGDCGPFQDFTSSVAPGTSLLAIITERNPYTTLGPPFAPLDDCETHVNRVSADKCVKDIDRSCSDSWESTRVFHRQHFEQESPTRIRSTVEEEVSDDYGFRCRSTHELVIEQQ